MKKLLIIALLVMSTLAKADSVNFGAVYDNNPTAGYSLTLQKDWNNTYFIYESQIGRVPDNTAYLNQLFSYGIKVGPTSLGLVGGAKFGAENLSVNGVGGIELGVTVPFYLGFEKPDESNFFLKSTTRELSDPNVGVNTQEVISLGVKF